MLILIAVASPVVRHLGLSIIAMGNSRWIIRLQGSEAGPDHLVLNHLPFAEDLRVAKFTPFDEKTEYLPSEEQLDAMSAAGQVFGAVLRWHCYAPCAEGTNS